MSYRVRSHKFCCCIPVRFGTCVSAVLGLVAGGLVTAGGAIELSRNGGNRENQISLGIQIGVYGLLALLSLFGLVGCIGRSEKAVKGYWVALITHLLFSIGTGAWFLYNWFKESDEHVENCMEAAESDGTITKLACEGGVALMKGVTVAILVVVWLLELWGCFIVRSYIWQLREEKAVNEKEKQPA